MLYFVIFPVQKFSINEHFPPIFVEVPDVPWNSFSETARYDRIAYREFSSSNRNLSFPHVLSYDTYIALESGPIDLTVMVIRIPGPFKRRTSFFLTARD